MSGSAPTGAEYLPALSEAQVALSQLERMARDPSIPTDRIESLYRLMTQERDRAAIMAFNRSMRLCQLEMEPIVRDTENTHIGNKYAKLEKIDGIMRPIYTKHGFSVRYGSRQSPRDGWIQVTCVVAHDAGHMEEHALDAPPDTEGTRGKQNKTGAQGVGSVVTYLRRYLQMMAFNMVLADEDDDGNGGRKGGKNWLQPLEERDHRLWMRNVKQLATDATDVQQLNAIETHRNVQTALRDSTPKVVQWLKDLFAAARERIEGPFDPLAEFRQLLAEMTAEELTYLNNHAKWLAARAKAGLLPEDEDALTELVAERKRELATNGEADKTVDNADVGA
jgi:hypothetical protein